MLALGPACFVGSPGGLRGTRPDTPRRLMLGVIHSARPPSISRGFASNVSAGHRQPVAATGASASSSARVRRGCDRDQVALWCTPRRVCRYCTHGLAARRRAPSASRWPAPADPHQPAAAIQRSERPLSRATARGSSGDFRCACSQPGNFTAHPGRMCARRWSELPAFCPHAELSGASKNCCLLLLPPHDESGRDEAPCPIGPGRGGLVCRVREMTPKTPAEPPAGAAMAERGSGGSASGAAGAGASGGNGASGGSGGAGAAGAAGSAGAAGTAALRAPPAPRERPAPEGDPPAAATRRRTRSIAEPRESCSRATGRPTTASST